MQWILQNVRGMGAPKKRNVSDICALRTNTVNHGLHHLNLNLSTKMPVIITYRGYLMDRWVVLMLMGVLDSSTLYWWDEGSLCGNENN